MSRNGKYPYVSCIKINGEPILPPVITPELSKELQNYKDQAIKLEQCLRNSKELTKNLEELFETYNQSTRPVSQLTFGGNSHIEALNISDETKENSENKKCNLSLDLIEITQYDDTGVTPILSNTIHMEKMWVNQFCDNEETNSSDVQGATNFQSTRNHAFNVSNHTNTWQCSNSELYNKPTTSPKPRLIRSNSYTLDTPSPILLAHLRKASCWDVKNADNGLSYSRNCTSLENNHAPSESSNFSSADTVYHKETSDRNFFLSTPIKSSEGISEVKSPTIEVYQTDISVQQITLNTNKNVENGLKKEEKTEKFFAKNPFDVFEPDSELLNVLKDIPEIYANEIVKLLKVQHLEQKERLERYDNLSGSPKKSVSAPEVFRSQSSSEKVMSGDAKDSTNSTNQSSTKLTFDNLIDFMSKANENLVSTPVGDNANCNRPHTTESCTTSDKLNSDKLRRSSTFSMSPSQSLYYSITSDTDSLTTPAPSAVKLIDLESNNGDDLEIGILREKNGYWEGVMMHENDKNINCGRELFPEIDPLTMIGIKRDWAASVIGAHIRGFLTRRLLKTEKMQGLIATIRDVLTCAVELHHSDTIDEKDVELHRRLINQLSAALYTFHDTFFDLSIPEQMLIIAADRQRKHEKLNRPQSSKSSSRPVSGKSANSSRSNKSLPSSRSSSKQQLVSGSPSLTKV